MARAIATWVMVRTRFRSHASARVPPHSEPARRGTSWVKPIIPTTRVEWVRWKAWKATATTVSWLPMPETVWPIQSRRKFRECRSGETSANSAGTRQRYRSSCRRPTVGTCVAGISQVGRGAPTGVAAVTRLLAYGSTGPGTLHQPPQPGAGAHRGGWRGDPGAGRPVGPGDGGLHRRRVPGVQQGRTALERTGRPEDPRRRLTRFRDRVRPPVGLSPRRPPLRRLRCPGPGPRTGSGRARRTGHPPPAGPRGDRARRSVRGRAPGSGPPHARWRAGGR